MAAQTTLKELELTQLANPTTTEYRLAKKIGNLTDTEIILNAEPLTPTGISITKDMLISVGVENMLVTAISDTTLTVVRGIPRGGEDLAGSTDNATTHEAGDKVVASVAGFILQQHHDALVGTIGTGNRNFKIGDATSNATQGFEIDQGISSSTTKYGADASGNPLITLPGGSSFIPGAGTGSLSGGDGIDLTASVISVDLTDTNKFSPTIAADKAVLYNGSGLINQGVVEVLKDVTSTAVELNKLDGASANVTATNLNSLTDGTQNALHSHDYTKDDMIGAPVTKARDTNHQATENGFLSVRISGGINATTTLTVKTDASNPPTTVVALVTMSDGANHPEANFLYPIKKSDFYRVETTSDSGSTLHTKTVKFIPMT